MNKIIEKLRKLIAHAKSAREIGNVAEAEAFAEKIQELLDTHNLSMSEIEIETAKSSVNHSHSGLHAINQWQQLFCNNLAAINGCRLVLRGTEITLVGSDVDRLIVIEIYEYFTELAKIFAENSLKEFKLTPEYKRKRKKIYHSRRFKHSFLHGFVFALIKRFREKHEAAQRSAEKSQALIFIGNKLAEAERWMENNIQFRNKPTKKFQRSKFNLDALNKGVEAGNSVALTTKTVS